MSNDQSYRPRSPSLPGLTEQSSGPRLGRLPSYQIQEPSLPKGYSFSPRGSYDASPFFTQPTQQNSISYFNSQQTNPYPEQFQSPPRFTPASLPEQSQVFSPVSYTEFPQQRSVSATYSSSPYQLPQQLNRYQFEQQQQQQQQQQIQAQQVQQNQHYIDEMARLRSRKPINYNEDQNSAQYEPPPPPMPAFPPHQQMHQPPPMQPQHQFVQQPMSLTAAPPQMLQPQPQPQQQPPLQQQQQSLSTSSTLPPVDVKTKFPVARIKRIMQADEDVGKVAQATPTAVSKALEMFMIALVMKGATEAKANNSKRVTATHLKHAVLTDPQFDFLNEICESVPDEGGKGAKGRAKSEAKSEDSDDDMAGAAASSSKKKAKGSGRKKKAGDTDMDRSE